MGLYHCRCLISGVSLRASNAILIILESTPAGHVPAALPLKGCYNCAGAIDGVKTDANTERILSFFTDKIEAGELIGDQDDLDEYFPFDDIETLLECLERNVTTWATAVVCNGERLVYALICEEIWNAIVRAAPPSPPDSLTNFRRVFSHSTLAPELYSDDLSEVEEHLRELSAVADFMTERGIGWRPLSEDDMYQHYEEIGQYLKEARQTFADSPIITEALNEYERHVRKDLYPSSEVWLGPASPEFAVNVAELKSSADPDDEDPENEDLPDDDDDGDDLDSDENLDDDDDDDDEDEDEDEDEDDETGFAFQSSHYETQEFIFYLGARNLGSFFMPVEADEFVPEPITRRFMTPPTKANMGSNFTLLWVEETEGGAETMMWTADTPEEVAEAQRLYDAARGLSGTEEDDDVADFTPVERSSEELILLQAIRENFADDGPLLNYADWLTRAGNAQGEFIRIDLEIARLDSTDPRHEELSERWMELLEEHGDEWYAPLAALQLFPYDRSFWIDRGVICSVEINRPKLLTVRARELFDAVPLLRSLSFDCEGLNVAELAEIPQMSQITSLELNYLDVAPDELTELLNSPYLTSLTDLELTGNDAGSDLVRAVVESPRWPQLRTLIFSSADIDDEGVQLIAAGTQPLLLNELKLNSNPITEAGLAALGRSQGLSNLTSLSLGEIEHTAAGLRGLRNSTWMPGLKSLSLKSCKIDVERAAVIADWPVANLTTLDLSSCELQDDALAALLESAVLGKVQELNLDYNKLGDVGIIAFTQSPQVASLKTLELSFNSFGDAGVMAIANTPYLPLLKTLKLDSINLTSEGVQALADSPYLQHLEWLWIGEENELNDDDRAKLIERFGESAVGI